MCVFLKFECISILISIIILRIHIIIIFRIPFTIFSIPITNSIIIFPVSIISLPMHAEELPVRRLERGSADTAPRVIAIALGGLMFKVKKGEFDRLEVDGLKFRVTFKVKRGECGMDNVIALK